MWILLLVACKGPDDALPSRIDGIILPDPTDVTWVQGVDNPYFPLPVGATWSYEATTDEGLETDHVEVLPETRQVHGVTATVVYDLVKLDGEIAEETWDWYAQDADGNVWYLGEDTCEYEDGACAVREGEWAWGEDGARPGWIMPANPTVDGQPYFQEYLKGEAEDVGEVIGVGETITVVAGTFTDCIRTADTSHLEPGLDEEKVFCPGVGNVFVDERDFTVDLVATTGL